MTNLDYIRSCTKEELAYLLCHELIEKNASGCHGCIASPYFGNGRVCFIDWLDAERTEHLTNFDYLRSCTKTDLASFLCREVNSRPHCSGCVARTDCSINDDGFILWLDMERSA